MYVQAESEGVRNFYACKGAHTLFTSQRERDKEREREINRESERESESERDR